MFFYLWATLPEINILYIYNAITLRICQFFPTIKHISDITVIEETIGLYCYKFLSDEITHCACACQKMMLGYEKAIKMSDFNVDSCDVRTAVLNDLVPRGCIKL